MKNRISNVTMCSARRSALYSASLLACLVFVIGLGGCNKAKGDAEKSAPPSNPNEITVDAALAARLKIGEPQVHDVANSLQVAARVETDASRVARIGSPVEFFRGDTDGNIRVNDRAYMVNVEGRRRTVEQPPQAIQGWTATRVWNIMRRRGLIA